MNYICKRILLFFPVFLSVTFLTYGLMYVAGGDPMSYFYENQGQAVSQSVIEAGRQKYGLDQPFFVQYGKWLWGMLHGQMGESFITGKDVGPLFLSKLPQTMYLAGISLAMTLCMSLPLGIVSALYKNRMIDYGIRLLSFIGNSMPNFLVAILLVFLLAVKYHFFPVVAIGRSPSVVLPALTLTVAMSAKYIRQIRAVVLEELGKGYVTGMRSRGFSNLQIVCTSVIPMACPAIITLLAISVGSLLGGTAVVETIFQWDGVGKLAVDAILQRDYPIIQIYVVWMAFIYIVVNLCGDVIQYLIDPRIRRKEIV